MDVVRMPAGAAAPPRVLPVGPRDLADDRPDSLGGPGGLGDLTPDAMASGLRDLVEAARNIQHLRAIASSRRARRRVQRAKLELDPILSSREAGRARVRDHYAAGEPLAGVAALYFVCAYGSVMDRLLAALEDVAVLVTDGDHEGHGGARPHDLVDRLGLARQIRACLLVLLKLTADRVLPAGAAPRSRKHPVLMPSLGSRVPNGPPPPGLWSSPTAA